MIVRRATVDDATRLSSTAMRAFADDPVMRWLFPDDDQYFASNGEMLLDRFGIIGPLMKAHTPAEEHWYLQLLGTHPDWQRQGIAAALMTAMFERADAEGRPCHLETETLTNVAYYRRHGFEVTSEFDIPTGDHVHRFSSWGGDPSTEVGPHMWGMLRPAR